MMLFVSLLLETSSIFGNPSVLRFLGTNRKPGRNLLRQPVLIMIWGVAWQLLQTFVRDAILTKSGTFSNMSFF